MDIEKKCEICKENDHKYKCPGCSFKTCSLKCCQEHKKIYNCSGQRDKTKFVKLQEFSERELLSDYNFLEEQSRLIDYTQRDTLKRKYDITSSMEYLKHLAFKQSKTVLQFMPRHSTKRLANRTRFDKNTKIINWHIEFKFNKNQVYSLNDLCSSKETIKEILCKFYKDNEFNLFLNDQPLNEYQTAFKFNDLNVLFETRNFTLKYKYYLKFDLNKSLENCLYKKTIIEYPILQIVLNKDLINYNIKTEDEILKEVHLQQQQQQQQKNIDEISKVEVNKDKEEGELEEGEEVIDNDDDDEDDEDDDYENDDSKKQKFFNDNFDLEIEFEKLKKGFSEAGINVEEL